jgi:hypothetical protein
LVSWRVVSNPTSSSKSTFRWGFCSLRKPQRRLSYYQNSVRKLGSRKVVSAEEKQKCPYTYNHLSYYQNPGCN